MKLILIILSTIICVNFSFSQEESLKKTQVEAGENSLSPEKRAKIEKEIAQIVSHINSINIKREYILNNPEENAIAESEGWYTDMDATIERLEARKEELQLLLD